MKVLEGVGFGVADIKDDGFCEGDWARRSWEVKTDFLFSGGDRFRL